MFNYIESTFYNRKVAGDINRSLARAASEIGRFHALNLERYGAAVRGEWIKSIFLRNQRREDILARTRAFGKLEEDVPSLMFIRFVDSGLREIHYSSLASDVRNTTSRSIEYSFFSDVEAADFIAQIARSEKSPFVVLSPEDNACVYGFRITGGYDAFAGYGLFYVSLDGLERHLMQAGVINLGEELALVESLGILLRADVSGSEDVKEAVTGYWAGAAQARPSFQGEGRRYIFFDRVLGDFSRIGIFAADDEFVLNPVMKGILLSSVFFTAFLVVFLVLSIRQDSSVVLFERIKKFQMNLLREYLERKEEIDWSKWQSELEVRRDDVRSELKRGLRLKKAEVEKFDALVDKSWDEIIAVLVSRREEKRVSPDLGKIEALIEKALANMQALGGGKKLASSPARLSRARPGDDGLPAASLAQVSLDAFSDEAEDVEEIGDAEELESLEELSDGEDAEAAAEASDDEPSGGDDADDAEDVEAVDEAEEAEDADDVDDVEDAEAADEASDDEPSGEDEADDAEDVEAVDEVEEAEDADDVDDVEDAEAAAEDSDDEPSGEGEADDVEVVDAAVDGEGERDEAGEAGASGEVEDAARVLEAADGDDEDSGEAFLEDLAFRPAVFSGDAYASLMAASGTVPSAGEAVLGILELGEDEGNCVIFPLGGAEEEAEKAGGALRVSAGESSAETVDGERENGVFGEVSPGIDEIWGGRDSGVDFLLMGGVSAEERVEVFAEESVMDKSLVSSDGYFQYDFFLKRFHSGGVGVIKSLVTVSRAFGLSPAAALLRPREGVYEIAYTLGLGAEGGGKRTVPVPSLFEERQKGGGNAILLKKPLREIREFAELATSGWFASSAAFASSYMPLFVPVVWEGGRSFLVVGLDGGRLPGAQDVRGILLGLGG
jgi:hypothetical protein